MRRKRKFKNHQRTQKKKRALGGYALGSDYYRLRYEFAKAGCDFDACPFDCLHEGPRFEDMQLDMGDVDEEFFLLFGKMNDHYE
jgi:hypothetical protein